MAGGLQLIIDALKASRKQAEPIRDAYNAGYRNLVHRAVGDMGSPALNPRVNANVGTHSDFVGGAQAAELEEYMRHAGLPNPGTMRLLARAKRPVFMTDAEVNDPLLMASALGDDALRKEVDWAQFRYPEHMIDLPAAGYDDAQIPLAKVLNRRAAERALKRRGHDSVIYPNSIEGNFSAYDPRFVDDAVLRSVKKREELARSIIENNPVPSYDDWVVSKMNPSLSLIDYSGYRLPFGDLVKKRDYTTHGYRCGGLARATRR